MDQLVRERPVILFREPSESCRLSQLRPLQARLHQLHRCVGDPAAGIRSRRTQGPEDTLTEPPDLGRLGKTIVAAPSLTREPLRLRHLLSPPPEPFTSNRASTHSTPRAASKTDDRSLGVRTQSLRSPSTRLQFHFYAFLRQAQTSSAASVSTRWAAQCAGCRSQLVLRPVRSIPNRGQSAPTVCGSGGGAGPPA